MIPAPIPENDEMRVASLERMNLLSTPRESDLERITRTAQKFFETEIALISLVDKERQWFKSRIGLAATESPRDVSFCGHAIQSEQPLVVTDAAADERFHDNPFVTDGPRIRFYAGQPLTNNEGFRVGTLCVISSRVRQFTEEEQQTLQDLGRMAEIALNNRKLSETQEALLASLAAANRDKLIDPMTGIWNRGGFEEMFQLEISRAIRAKSALAIAMIDIDHFKKINDTFGHSTGDEAIRLAASLLVDSCRATDVVARYGGEEFIVVAPDVVPATLPTLGEKLVQRFRHGAKMETPEGPCSFTVSVGLTIAVPRKGLQVSPETYVESADQALYAAKGNGRDRFEISGVPDSLYADFALA